MRREGPRREERGKLLVNLSSQECGWQVLRGCQRVLGTVQWAKAKAEDRPGTLHYALPSGEEEEEKEEEEEEEDEERVKEREKDG
ncbi:hypothetical protein E2C01_047540 [Portunus trituberculatus]|uniref:Uncharacterized protein n=1 Tax=Portunus trituberculatus TaxID=210409 RepID=A0A5B7G3W8_PORTR|nr:hypothetical protein [Portunus trituberculatus]